MGLGIATPGFDAMRQALPMVQGFLIMTLAISIPFIMLFSGYSIKAAMVITFTQFGLYFLTFWWELARWLDTWLLSTLHGNDLNYSMWNIAGIMNSSDDVIVKIVIGAMYIVLPMFFLGALGKAGVHLGSISESLLNGSKASQAAGSQAAQRGANAATTVATRKASK